MLCKRVYTHFCTHMHTCMPSGTLTPMHGVYIHKHPPTNPPDPYMPFTCIRFAYIAIVPPETYKHTDSLPYIQVKSWSFLHFLLLTHLHFEISLTYAHIFFYRHIHSCTPTVTHLRTERTTFCPPSFSHLFLFHTHPHSNPSLSLLSLSPTQFVSWFPTGWAVAAFFAHTLTGQATHPASCQSPGPSVPPTPTWGWPSTGASTVPGGFSVTQEAERPGRACPLSPDRHSEPAPWGQGMPPNQATCSSSSTFLTSFSRNLSTERT